MTTIAGPAGVLVQPALDAFEAWIGAGADHHIHCGDEDYVQPFVYLSFHLISMRAAGWDTDFDDVAVVSGASALFAHQPREFMCKYAHLDVDPDRRICEATGFGYQWRDFEGAEGAWGRIRQGVDTGRPQKGWDRENVLFVGYRDAAMPAQRQVYALVDGPETAARWWSWAELEAWVQRMGDRQATNLGQFEGRHDPDPPAQVARRVLCYLVAWSEMPPADVQGRYPAATFGLAGMAAYAANCANVKLFDTWSLCHDINGWWTLRNSTAVWLRRLAVAGTLGPAARADLETAADGYRAAYLKWRRGYERLGARAGAAAHRNPARRLEVAGLVRQARRQERQAVSHLRRVLEEKCVG